MTLIEIDARTANRSRRSFREHAAIWGRTLLVGLIGAAAVALLAIAALAVTLVGLAIAAAALTLRMTQRKPRAQRAGPVILEARRMPDGWAAEPPRA
ncbi:MAG: hypothetical protein GC206_04195 [Alphaproteobacteria bacterium]|nr:hypothetical protein [Alphaproteobacteria bacterium]